MAWHLTGDREAFLATAGGFLRPRAAENTIVLGAMKTLRARGAAAFGDEPPLFGWHAADGTVDAAFMHTPPFQ